MTEKRSGAHHGLMVAILALALFLRLYGLNWDDGYLYHPDERQILIVTDRLSLELPSDLSLLLTPESPWNPGFFAYGSMPIYLLRASSDLLGLKNPDLATLDGTYIVGRVLSALFDVGTVWLVYYLGRKLYTAWTGILAALLVTMTVLHIQLSHFYAVDTILSFFIVLVTALAVRVVRKPTLRRALGLGCATGAALATKISAAPLLGIIFLAWLFGALGWPAGVGDGVARTGRGRIWWRALLGCVVSGAIALFVFVLLEPYALIDAVTFVVDLITEGYMARGVVDIPYTRQFIGTLPFLYPLRQMVVWSLGIPLGSFALLGFAYALVGLVAKVRRRDVKGFGEQLLPLAWVVVYFGIVGSFHAKFLRYLLPIIPFLCLWAAHLGERGLAVARRRGKVATALAILGCVLILGGTTLYAMAFMNVYRSRHPWLQATAWLCEHLPRRSGILIEHWDDPLPMIQGDGSLGCYRQHDFSVFPAYDPDTTEKRDHLLAALERCDYVILSSNRLYNTIPRLKERYPFSSRYYELLLDEQLGFELVYYAAVYPRLFGVNLVNDTFSDPDLPQPTLLKREESLGVSIDLGRADESFTVYDHPKPLVFAKTGQLSHKEFLDLFGAAAQDLPEPEAE